MRIVGALGLRTGIAFPQMIAAADGSLRVIEVAARIPGGQMADLVRHAVGVDLVEVALRQALGDDVSDDLDLLPKSASPWRSLLHRRARTASDRARRGSVDPSKKVIARRPGRSRRELHAAGRDDPAVRRDGDRRGYVIAIGDTGPEALARSEAAAALVEVEVA